MAMIARMLLVNARHHRDRVAVVAGDRRTWGEVAERAAGLAGGLRRRGLAPGDRVALVSDNVPEILESFYAAAGSGLVVSPSSTRSHPAELDRYFGEYVQPRGALLGPGSEACLGGWLDRCDAVVALPGGPAGEPYEEVVAGGGELRDDVDPDAPFTIGQTSGTTGRPKGAVITQRSAASAIFSFVAEIPIATGDAYLIQHPMANVPGGPGQLFPLPEAARTVLLPRFEPAACLAAIEEHRVTHTVLVPTMLHDVLRHPDRAGFDTSSLKRVIVGAAPVPRRLLEEAVEAFGEVFRPMYGMTESTSVACVLRPDDMYPVAAQPPGRLLSAGTPSAGVEVRVVRDDGSEVARDGVEFGEILLRGGNVVRRYWGDVPENATSWDGEWFRTGDVATVDGAGFLTIVDRTKDVIISGGTNVASREVEEVLGGHPAVGQVAVVGVPHERWGEAVTAVVVRAPGHEAITAEELVEHCRDRLGGPKVPKAVHFVEALPTNPMGKVLKAELRERLAEGTRRA